MPESYAEKILHNVYAILNDSIEDARLEAEAKYGGPLKVTSVRLDPAAGVAKEGRTVYDVYLTFERTSGSSSA